MMKVCPGCKRRRQVGQCQFGGPNVVIKDHCRECCGAPDRDKWSPTPARKLRTTAVSSRR